MNLRNHPLMTGFKYYYTTLSNHDKKIYIDIFGAVCQRKKSVTTTKSCVAIHELIEMIINDNPLLFYFRDYTCASILNKMTISFEYLLSEDKIENLADEVYLRVENIVRVVEFNNDYEKELYFHDFFAKRVSYNDNAPKYSFMAIGPILYGSGVCAGISAAFKLLCDLSKIPCIIAVGKTKNELHAWNKVYIGGCFYNIDVTYDVTLSDGDYIRYDYFNVSDSDLESERAEITVTPHCSSKRCNYHVVNGCYFESESELRRYIANCINSEQILNLRIAPALFQYNAKEKIMGLIENSLRGINCILTYTYIWDEEQRIFIYKRKRCKLL